MIQVERTGPDGTIAIVTIDRPERRNAMDGATIQGLLDAFAGLRDDMDVRAVVLTGSGGFFSAGADHAIFEGVEAEKQPNRTRRALAAGSRLCREIETLPQVTIAAIEGGAVGGGLGLAVSCDWRVMAANAYAYVPEAKLGLNYGWNTLPRLTTLVGPARTKTMSILCDRHTAAECADWGLADRLTDPGGALEGALDLARQASALPQMAVQLIKRTVNSYATALVENTSAADMELMLVCMADPEGAAARVGLTRSKT